MRTFTVAITAAVVLLIAGVALLWGLGVVQVDFGNLGRESREARAAREFFNVVQTSGLDHVQTSLAAGADVNATDETGQTPLVYAAGANTDPERGRGTAYRRGRRERPNHPRAGPRS